MFIPADVAAGEPGQIHSRRCPGKRGPLRRTGSHPKKARSATNARGLCRSAPAHWGRCWESGRRRGRGRQRLQMCIRDRLKAEENGGGLRRKPQTWASQRSIGQKRAHFFAPASVMSTFRIQIGDRHENLVTCGAKNRHQSASIGKDAGPQSAARRPLCVARPDRRDTECERGRPCLLYTSRCV